MAFSREELDWIEAEWAFHLHGRSAFLSREDFAQLQAWDKEGVPAEALIGAMEAYFGRRAKRAKPRGFVALSHLERDVVKAMKVREALRRAGPEVVERAEWEGVKEPLASDPRGRAAFETWRRLQGSMPSPESPGYLEHFDAERQAYRALVALAEASLGGRAEALREELTLRLRESKIGEGTLVWKRAWEHHWSRMVCEGCGIQG